MKTRAMRAAGDATKRACLNIRVIPTPVPNPKPEDIVLRLLVEFPGESQLSSRVIEYSHGNAAARDGLAESFAKIAGLVATPTFRKDLKLTRESDAWGRLRKLVAGAVLAAACAGVAAGCGIAAVLR